MTGSTQQSTPCPEEKEKPKITNRIGEQTCDNITNAVDKWIRDGGTDYSELQEIVMIQLSTSEELAEFVRDAELWRKFLANRERFGVCIVHETYSEHVDDIESAVDALP